MLADPSNATPFKFTGLANLLALAALPLSANVFTAAKVVCSLVSVPPTLATMAIISVALTDPVLVSSVNFGIDYPNTK
jgi:hypothetical protein